MFGNFAKKMEIVNMQTKNGAGLMQPGQTGFHQ